MNNSSNCYIKLWSKHKKIRTSRKSVHDWKVQFEKVQFTRDLKSGTIVYQGFCLTIVYQGFRKQATIVLLPEDTCTTFQAAKVEARMMTLYKKNNYSNPYHLNNKFLIRNDQTQIHKKISKIEIENESTVFKSTLKLN